MKLCDFLLLVLCSLIAVNGCAPARFPKDKYAGNFRAINLSDRAIVMGDCSGFGFASPESGVLIPKAPSGRHFGPLPEFPAKTTIHWHDDQENRDFKQTVELADVVPRGVDGETLFEFTAALTWTVRFIPAARKNSSE